MPINRLDCYHKHMRLYLSSFRLGNKPNELHKLLMGGKRTALVMNAIDFHTGDARSSRVAKEIDDLKSINLEPTEVDLRQYFGKEDELKELLSSFDLIWVRGGNAFVLRRAFKQSGADRAIKELLDEDAIVYGGYSAGIDMLIPSLHGTELVDDPNIVPDGYESEIVWDCLGILPYSVAPHYKSDHPESAAVDTSVEWMIDNHVLFVALRDGEVIVRNGSEERIVG